MTAETPIARFLRRGHRLAHRLRLPPGSLEEGVSILRVALGEEWISRNATAAGQKFSSPVVREEWHPIGVGFGIAGSSQIVEMLELAAYLKVLARIPRIESVVDQLRSNYAHTFLQLAMAFRLQRTGIPVHAFEPATSKGRFGDIECQSAPSRLFVECYCPMLRGRDASYDLHCLGKALGRFRDHPIRVDIRAKRELDSSDRKRISSFLASLDANNISPTSWTDESATVVIQPIEPRVETRPGDEVLSQECGDAIWIMEVGVTTRVAIEDYDEDWSIRRTRGSQLRVWYPDQKTVPSEEEFAADLAGRISRKMTQAGAPETARLVIASIPRVEDRDERIRVLSFRLAHHLHRRHESWNGVLLVNRRWLPENRFMYFGSWIPGPTEPAIDDAVFARMNRLEESEDVLRELGAAR